MNPGLVASASLIVLLVVVYWTRRQAPIEEQSRLQSVLAGSLGVVIAVAAIAMVWTFTRP